MADLRDLATIAAGHLARPFTAVRPNAVSGGKARWVAADPQLTLSLREVNGHRTYAGSTVTCWYVVPATSWAFRPDGERELQLTAIAGQYAQLAGTHIQVRRTTRPFNTAGWARQQHAANPNPVGHPGWYSQQVNQAVWHLERGAYHDGVTYLGVTVPTRLAGDGLVEAVRAKLAGAAKRTDEERLTARLAEIDDIVAGPGLKARPATADEIAWLIYRSVGPGITPPDVMLTGAVAAEDVVSYVEHLEWHRTPYGSSIRVVNTHTGQESHVAVLSVGRIEPLRIPEEHIPWLHLPELLDWPVEISVRGKLLSGRQAAGALHHRLRIIRSVQRDYAAHGIDAPADLQRKADLALQITDQVDTGLPVDAARFHGFARIAVHAPTGDELKDRVNRITRLYDDRLRIQLRRTGDQAPLAREFIPGEPAVNTGFVRQLPVRLLSMAVPNAAATVGDPAGDLIGETAGTGRTPVRFDVNYAPMVRQRSGLTVLAADPGAGKSTLVGALGYLAAVRGVEVTLFDPSGPLAALCDMPALAGHTRLVNLTGSQPGTLAPYALIPNPDRATFDDGPTGDAEHATAVADARSERRDLVLDICSMLLPPQVAGRDDTTIGLRAALRNVPADETSTLDDVIDALTDAGDLASKHVAGLLEEAQERPLARLFFGSPPDGTFRSDAKLTVITMGGLSLPDMRVDRQYWSAQEALALPMLHTAFRLAVRRCYSGDRNRRKLAGLDEAHLMGASASGRGFLVRLARDSRKFNIGALVASQNPADILGLEVQNLVSTVFVGRVAEDSEVMAEALRMLRLPGGVGYEQTVAGLSLVAADDAGDLPYREFVMRDVNGRTEKIRVDVSYLPGLLAALNTTPGGAR